MVYLPGFTKPIPKRYQRLQAVFFNLFSNFQMRLAEELHLFFQDDPQIQGWKSNTEACNRNKITITYYYQSSFFHTLSIGIWYFSHELFPMLILSMYCTCCVWVRPWKWYTRQNQNGLLVSSVPLQAVVEPVKFGGADSVDSTSGRNNKH